MISAVGLFGALRLSQDELGTPALAFVKAVCHLMALDSAVLDEVLLLRRQLLRLIHCKEFSAASEFKVGGLVSGGGWGGGVLLPRS